MPAGREIGDREEVLFVQGMIAFSEGRYDEAGEKLGAYAEKGKTDARAWTWCGHAWLHARGKADRAVAALTQAFQPE